MKQLFAALVAAVFAATSFAALAQDKKDKGMEKKAEAKTKADAKKTDGKAKADTKKTDGKAKADTKKKAPEKKS